MVIFSRGFPTKNIEARDALFGLVIGEVVSLCLGNNTNRLPILIIEFGV
ncbi:hypothetical protein P4S73_11585 [Paraglaciecola sp. Hal342]